VRRSYSSNSYTAISRTFHIKALLTPPKIPTNAVKTKSSTKDVSSTLHHLPKITVNLSIIDPNIAYYNNITMSACLIHFCVNEKETSMMGAYRALLIMWHTYFMCGAVWTQDLTKFLAALERIMFVQKVAYHGQLKGLCTDARLDVHGAALDIKI
jgi:membrane-anchored glycerophosphoryl diester phosphodiesterase (GDPDase)